MLYLRPVLSTNPSLVLARFRFAPDFEAADARAARPFAFYLRVDGGTAIAEISEFVALVLELAREGCPIDALEGAVAHALRLDDPVPVVSEVIDRLLDAELVVSEASPSPSHAADLSHAG